MKKLRLSLAGLLASTAAVLLAVITLVPNVFALNNNPLAEQPGNITFGPQHNVSNFDQMFEWRILDDGIALVGKVNPPMYSGGNIVQFTVPAGTLLGYYDGYQNKFHTVTGSQSATTITIYLSDFNDGEVEANLNIGADDFNFYFNKWQSGNYVPASYVLFKMDARPVISGQENFVTSVDDPKNVSYFQAFLSAYDETDGNLTNQIYIVTDNYTPNKAVLGKHKVVFGVEDSAGNETTFEAFINVIDNTKPVITGNSTKVQISYTQTWNINSFKSTLVATDNYDTLTNADIFVKTDGYTSNKTNLGTYTVVFGVKDSSGNEGTFSKQVEVIDDVAPIINGPTTLTKPSNGTLTINEILDQLTATDEKEGNVTSSLKVIADNYTGKGNIVGSYTIVFEAEDSKGNAATHTVTVQVIDNIAPVFYIKDGVSIVLPQSVELTHQQIIDLLIASEQLPVGGTTTFSFPIDEYSGNSDTPGVYAMQVLAKSTNGNEYSHTFGITVMEDEEGGIIIDEPIDWFGWWDDTVEWVEENPYIAGGIGIGVLALIGLLIYASKRKPKNKRRRRK